MTFILLYLSPFRPIYHLFHLMNRQNAVSLPQGNAVFRLQNGVFQNNIDFSGQKLWLLKQRQFKGSDCLSTQEKSTNYIRRKVPRHETVSFTARNSQFHWVKLNATSLLLKDNRLVRESLGRLGNMTMFTLKNRIYMDVSRHFPLEKSIFEGNNS